MAAIDELLRVMLEKGGSDLHLSVGRPPTIRVSGAQVHPLRPRPGQRKLLQRCDQQEGYLKHQVLAVLS